MNGSLMECPRCGFSQPAAEECARCGVLVRKAHASPPPLPRPPAEADPPARAGAGGIAVVLVLLATAAGLFVAGRARAPRAAGGSAAVVSARGWYEGADGYRQADDERRRLGRPMAVYFHTDWCGWCKKMDAEILSAPETEAYLRGVAKVEINPEKGREEAALARDYDIRGYPSFFIVPAAGGGGRRVHPFTQDGTMSPAEFVAACRAAE